MSRRAGWVFFLILVFVAVSRPLFWPAHPPNFDFANFALAVERFDPFEHHPHPPGYPLVILLARIFAAAGVPVVRALYLTSLVGSLAAVCGAYCLGRRLAGETGGLLASLLMAVEPVFWYSGVSSPVRVYLSAGVCWLLYGLTEAASGRRPFLWATAGLLALFAGFRPNLLVFFVLPGVVAARLGGFRWRAIAGAAGLCLAACAPWMLWIASTFDSPYQWLRTYYYYFLHHISTTSALFGAPAGAWQGMLRNALYWNGTAAAVALLAFLLGRRRAALDGRFYRIAGAYFIAGITVQLFVHVGADTPDHALDTIAILVVLSGSLLAAAARASARSAVLAASVVGLALGSVFTVSFAAPGKHRPELNILSLRSFTKSQQPIAETVRNLRTSLRSGDAIVVSNDSAMSWRILQYEFPGNVVLALESTIQPAPAGPPGGWRFFRGRQTPLSGPGISLPRVDRLQIFASPGGPQRKLILDRVCGQANCEVRTEWIQADLGSSSRSLDLPPYTLRLEWDRHPCLSVD